MSEATDLGPCSACGDGDWKQEHHTHSYPPSESVYNPANRFGIPTLLSLPEMTPEPAGPFSNGLTPAEIERLAISMEEMGEAIQEICKILRHGYESRWPKTYGPTNRSRLEKELGHVRNSMNLLIQGGDVSEEAIERSKFAKSLLIKPYLHHQEPV